MLVSVIMHREKTMRMIVKVDYIIVIVDLMRNRPTEKPSTRPDPSDEICHFIWNPNTLSLWLLKSVEFQRERALERLLAPS